MSSEGDVRLRVSQLCKPLWNCLHDQSPLSILEYFVQFMTTRNALHLLQFWFSVASFKNAQSSSMTEAPSHYSNNPTTSEPLVQGDDKSRFEGSCGRTLQSSQASAVHNNPAIAGVDNSDGMPRSDQSTCHVSGSIRQTIGEVKPSGYCGDGDCDVSCIEGLNGLNGRRGREREGSEPVIGRGNQSSVESQREGATPEISRQTSLSK